MKKNYYLRAATLILLVLVFSNLFAGAARQIAARGNAPELDARQPKLVVLIVLDQFRADYISRFYQLFGTKGFKRLITRGAYFTNTNYPYANTYTAVGHATIASGSIPAIHGMIGNE